jgi:hypothetical protein
MTPALTLTLTLEGPEVDALDGLLDLAERVNDDLTEGEADLAMSLHDARAAWAATAPARDLVDAAPAAGATTWQTAFPALTDDAAEMILHGILSGPAQAAAIAVQIADNPLQVTVAGMLDVFRGNCWDDQHDGGAHRQDLIDVNRLIIHLGGEPDDLAEVLALVDDDMPEPERWEQRP